jgi:FKBP-type peptidyl-prolyl cis-trans isomerase FkpA
LDGDHIADKFFHALGDQGTKAYPGVRATDPAGSDLQTISQLNFSQRIAASRVSRTQPWTTTASGLMFEDVKVGTGPAVSVTQQVTIHFVASKPNGEVVTGTRAANQPLTFLLNNTQVMAGLREAVRSMNVGGMRRAFVPPSLLIGSVPSGLPVGDDLVFEIELLSATSV